MLVILSDARKRRHDDGPNCETRFRDDHATTSNLLDTVAIWHRWDRE
jgi:hypothetical protein